MLNRTLLQTHVAMLTWGYFAMNDIELSISGSDCISLATLNPCCISLECFVQMLDPVAKGAWMQIVIDAVLHSATIDTLHQCTAIVP